MFQIGVDVGMISANPPAGIGKVKVAPKKLDLPSTEQFRLLVETIESTCAACARDCADLVRFLADSGCRITEAAHVTWRER